MLSHIVRTLQRIGRETEGAIELLSIAGVGIPLRRILSD
jgi:hypothetical protein